MTAGYSAGMDVVPVAGASSFSGGMDVIPAGGTYMSTGTGILLKFPLPVCFLLSHFALMYLNPSKILKKPNFFPIPKVGQGVVKRDKF